MVSTIFFDGFGPWGGEHVGEIDPSFWDKNSNVSLSEYRTDRIPSGSNGVVNGTLNGLDFMGYTFGATVKLNSYLQDADRSYLKAQNFPASFSAQDTAFGLGFFINKIATDSIARPAGVTAPDYSSNFISINNGNQEILLLEAIHLGTPGYPQNNPKIGLRVKQKINTSYEVMGTFTFDVFGSPWYTEQNPNNVSRDLQRTINAYDYKYGGLYVEICAASEVSPTNPTKRYSLQIKINGMNLLVDGTENDKKIYIRDSWHSYGVSRSSFSISGAGSKYAVGNTFSVADSAGGTGGILTVSSTNDQGGISNFVVTASGSNFVNTPIVTPVNISSNKLTSASIVLTAGGSGYSNGDVFVVTDSAGGKGGVINAVVDETGAITGFTLVEAGFGFTTAPIVTPAVNVVGTNAVFTTNTDNFASVNGANAILTPNIDNFTITSSLPKKYFDNFIFYGSRIPKNDNSDPLNYWSGSYNQQYMYHTYLDNIYVVGGTSDQECFLGPTTKVFNITPIAGPPGSTVNSNSSWQAFNLQWNTNTSIEDNLKDSNGDRSYVYTETSGAILAMDMENIPSDPNYAIGGIKITNSVRKSNKDTSFVNVWGTGTDFVSMSGIGSNFAVTDNNYQYKNQYLLTNPITNTGWTFSDINDGKFGIKKTS